MANTMTEKILAAHAGLDTVNPGQLIEVQPDLVMGNDITAPVAISELENHALQVKYPDKIALVLDHFVPNKDIKAAAQCKTVREFSKKYNIEKFYDVGKMGIEHALLPEQGLVAPGECVIGADSHTCTYGALGAFSTGVGSTDMAYGMATGKAWFRVPGAIKVEFSGSLPRFVSGKDVILQLISQLGVDGATYKSLEFTGDGISSLSMDDRFTIANMVVECGAKNGIFPVDAITLEYEKNSVNRDFKIYEADPDAEYEKTITIKLDELVPLVAKPHLPSNVCPASDCSDIKIDQVVIGSCTNGRISDMRAAAETLKGQKIADGVRCIIIPATQAVWRQCMNEGLFDIFLDAGAVISTPTCGPCLGGYMGILAEGERCVSTTNRNFVGRMGHKNSEVYLASPYTAAASAIEGYISVKY